VQSPPNPRRPAAHALLCGFTALVVCGLAVTAVLMPHGAQLSALVRMSHTDGMATIAQRVDPSFVFVPPGSHTDGTYYYAIALDPFARGEPHTLIDEAAYRYGHPVYGWLAGILSLGNAAVLPRSLVTLALLGAAAAAIAVSLIAREAGWSPWYGLLVAFSPGVIICVIQDLAEPVGIAFAAFGLLFWYRGRLVPSAVLFVAASLTKEELVLVPVALAIWHGVELLRGRAPDRVVGRVAAVAAGPAALVAWYAYVHIDLGMWPTQTGTSRFGLPFVGWIDTFNTAGAFITGDFATAQLGTFMVPILAITATALLLGAARAARLRSPLDAIFLLFVAFAAFLNWWTLLFPKDLVRTLLVPLLLLPAVYATHHAVQGSVRRRNAVAADDDRAPRSSAIRIQQPHQEHGDKSAGSTVS
jgi:hypothetical protein